MAAISSSAKADGQDAGTAEAQAVRCAGRRAGNQDTRQGRTAMGQQQHRPRKLQGAGGYAGGAGLVS